MKRGRVAAAGASVVGVWEVHAPDAPFPWHVMTFTPYGTMMQSNPHEGNQDESDSSGHGIWEAKKDSHGNTVIVGRFVEFKADRETGEYIGKGVIEFSFVVSGDTFEGDSRAYRYDAEGVVVAGPLRSPLYGKRFSLAVSVY